MIGVDLAKISRFKKPTNAFIERVLHKEEIINYFNSKDKQFFLATRWAIKEALFKVDNSLFHFNKINVLIENRVFKYKNFIITTSREKDFCIAIVFLKEKNES